jgi:Glycosyltransferase sugar-binding region containing DXD motif
MNLEYRQMTTGKLARAQDNRHTCCCNISGIPMLSHIKNCLPVLQTSFVSSLWIYNAYFIYVASSHPTVLTTKVLVVHSTWNESLNEAFPQVLEYRSKWEALGFEVFITPNEKIREDILAMDQLIPLFDLLTMFDNLATTNMKFDVWRYTKLYLEGGIYADVDVEPLNNRIVEYVKQSQMTGLPVIFEESNWPNNVWTRFLIPRLSDYNELPSYGSCVVVSPGRQNAFFLDLLQDMHPDRWLQAKEPQRTLMSVGPGHVTQFVKRQPSMVTLVGYHDREQVFIHHGFGTWKMWMPKEYWAAYYISMVLSLIIVGILFSLKFQKRCCLLRRRKTVVVYPIGRRGDGKL